MFVNMRNRNWEKCELVNAVLYLVKTGCQWRILLCTAFIDERTSADCGTQFSLIL
ncbi:MAG: hypothetical protein IJK81_13820 [Selenomonadaceae bacterium]|nr:hypothetical protein [Selenomonadaceae bacterium]